jgi:hypothetical protein
LMRGDLMTNINIIKQLEERCTRFDCLWMVIMKQRVVDETPMMHYEREDCLSAWIILWQWSSVGLNVLLTKGIIWIEFAPSDIIKWCLIVVFLYWVSVWLLVG